MTTADQWLTFLLHNAIRGTAVLVAAFALAFALRRASAATRNLVWTWTVICLLALPVLSLLLPAWHVELVPQLPAISWESPSAHGIEQSGAPVEIEDVTTENWQVWALLAWAAGLLASLGRLSIGTGLVWWIAHRAKPIHTQDWDDLMQALARRIGLERPVVLLESGRTGVPMTWGILRPVILLPPGARHWSPERRRIVLAHELTHVKRLDHLRQILAQVACGLYWFQPLAWLAAGQFRKERERTCDDSVLSLGARGSEYAEHLLDLARSLNSSQEEWSMAVGMAELSNLEGRLRAVLNPKLNRQSLTRRATALAALAVISVVLPFAAGSPAQIGAATISGVVRDPSGAVVPGAAVTVSNPDTRKQEIVSTNAVGRYTFASLPAGRYTLEVKQRGFKLFQRKDVLLNSSALETLDVTLDVGSVSETIDVVGGSRRALQAPSGAAPQRIRVGGNLQATKLIRMVKPAYPPHADAQGIEGTVLLHAVIATDGSLLSLGVTNTLVDPELAKAALDAVSQWRYQPTLLNGVPVEVATTITVNFHLAP